MTLTTSEWSPAQIRFWGLVFGDKATNMSPVILFGPHDQGEVNSQSDSAGGFATRRWQFHQLLGSDLTSLQLLSESLGVYV